MVASIFATQQPTFLGFAPINTELPLLTGTPTVGETLHVTDGRWNASPAEITPSYQWNRDSIPIDGATTNNYVLVAEDEGFAIQCQVTATNAKGSTSVLSNAVGPIAPAP